MNDRHLCIRRPSHGAPHQLAGTRSHATAPGAPRNVVGSQEIAHELHIIGVGSGTCRTKVLGWRIGPGCPTGFTGAVSIVL